MVKPIRSLGYIKLHQISLKSVIQLTTFRWRIKLNINKI